MLPQIYKPVPNNCKWLKCLLSLWINSVFTRPGRFHFWIYTPILQPPLLAPRGSGLAANLAYHLRMDDGILWHLSKAHRILRRSIGLWRNNIWLVVSTPLKNISQLGLLFPIYGEKKMFQTTNQLYSILRILKKEGCTSWKGTHVYIERVQNLYAAQKHLNDSQKQLGTVAQKQYPKALWACGL